MFVEFEIRQGKKANKDGTRTIRAYVGHNSSKCYFSTKYAIKPVQWDSKRNKIKEDAPNSQAWNGELTRIKNEIEGLCLKYPKHSARDICRLIGKNSTITFLSFFDQFIKDTEAGKIKRSIGTAKNYHKVLNRIKAFTMRSDFDTINMKWYEGYVGKMRETANENTVGSHIKVIKMILRAAHEAGVSTNEEYRKKYFKKPSESTDSIYLTEADIDKIKAVNLSYAPHLERERDRFMIQYSLLLRFEDSISFGEGNFQKMGKKLTFVYETGKTKTRVFIPVSTFAYDLLKKYNFKMPHITNQEANRHLTKIGMASGLNEVVTVGKLTRPKYDHITSHTARRSAATNLYLAGIDIKTLSHLLGHARIAQTEQYIRIDRLESAKKAAGFEFFK